MLLLRGCYWVNWASLSMLSCSNSLSAQGSSLCKGSWVSSGLTLFSPPNSKISHMVVKHLGHILESAAEVPKTGRVFTTNSERWWRWKMGCLADCNPWSYLALNFCDLVFSLHIIKQVSIMHKRNTAVMQPNQVWAVMCRVDKYYWTGNAAPLEKSKKEKTQWEFKSFDLWGFLLVLWVHTNM